MFKITSLYEKPKFSSTAARGAAVNGLSEIPHLPHVKPLDHQTGPKEPTFLQTSIRTEFKIFHAPPYLSHHGANLSNLSHIIQPQVVL